MERFPFSSLLWESAVKSWGGIISILGLSATILSFFIIPNESVIKVRFIMIVVMVMSSLLIIALRAAWLSHQLTNLPTPKVIYVKDAIKPYCNCHALFVIDPTPLLSNDALVSVYYLEHGFEDFVGLGKVINVQDDKRIQVVVTDNYNFEDRLDKIKGNLRGELDKLVIKTSIPSFILQGGLNER